MDDQDLRIKVKKENIKYFILAICSVPFVLFSFMLFDAPGSETSLLTNWLFFSLVFFPITTIISNIAAVFSFVTKKYFKTAYYFSLIPKINLYSLLFSFLCIIVFNGGKF